MDFTGKSVLLTGASSGIGFELFKKLSIENCKIAILARSIDKLQNFTSAYKTTNNLILPVYCDVSKKKDVGLAVDKVIDSFGGINIAILNAGIGGRVSIENFSSEPGEKIIGVNLLGNIYLLEKLLPYFLKKKDGLIAGISSLADTRGFPQSAFYNASKAGFTRLLESLRIELKNYGVKIITIRPGFVKTPLTDKNEFFMPLLMSAEKAADIIIKGIKKDRKRIRFPKLMVIGTKLIGIMPDSLFEYFAGKHLDSLKKKNL